MKQPVSKRVVDSESDGGRGMWYGGIAVNLASSTCSVLSGLGRVGRIH